jgi:hypothetical protein
MIVDGFVKSHFSFPVIPDLIRDRHDDSGTFYETIKFGKGMKNERKKSAN